MAASAVFLRFILFSFLVLIIICFSHLTGADDVHSPVSDVYESAPDNTDGVRPVGVAEKIEYEWRLPSVFVAILVRNKAHTLPYFLHYLENLDYPKQRMRLWIRSDHNEDDSSMLLDDWLVRITDQYNSVDYVDNNTEKFYRDASGPFDWSDEHMTSVIRLRQEALNAARASWADYVLFVDADNFLMNRLVLRDLIHADRVIVGAMLNTTASPHYSNFWAGMDDRGYYRRTDDYGPILHRERLGTFAVALVHSLILIDLCHPSSRHLSYNPPPPGYQGPIDDIIILAHSAQHSAIQMNIMNTRFYGYMLVPMEAHHGLEDEMEQFIHLKQENIILGTPLTALPYMNVDKAPTSKLDFDEVYMINLERRPDRKTKMAAGLRELDINVTLVRAVDGRLLNDTYLKSLGVRMMPGYADPYGGRVMTMGEIGCFLSHYRIWQDMLLNNYGKVIVFEDDVRFGIYFKSRLRHLLRDISVVGANWDLVYLGRKRLHSGDEESYVSDSRTLVWPRYSYWTIGYMLSRSGAVKLVQQSPLNKMVPVDEYLPIMFDQHPQDNWKKYFEPRNLIAFSAYPLLIEPTHYTGEPGYVTDTENSPIIDDVLVPPSAPDHLADMEEFVHVVQQSKVDGDTREVDNSKDSRTMANIDGMIWDGRSIKEGLGGNEGLVKEVLTEDWGLKKEGWGGDEDLVGLKESCGVSCNSRPVTTDEL